MLGVNKCGFQIYDTMDAVMMSQNLAPAAKHKANHGIYNRECKNICSDQKNLGGVLENDFWIWFIFESKHEFKH